MKRFLVIALIVVAGGSGAFLLSQRNADGTDNNTPTSVAKRGPLTISVTESGTVKARELEIIKSEVEGRTTILYLVPEGTRVTKGDLLVELDTASLEDRLVEQEIQVKNSETAYVQARENLEVVKKQSESDIALAERDHRFALEDLKQYEEGEFPKLLKEANSKITLEKEELEIAIEKLKWSTTLFEEKYIAESELESDRLARNRAELDHELAVANRDLLQDYTYKRTIDTFQSDIEETARALERVKLRTSSDIVQAEANLDNRAAEFNRQKSKLTKLKDQIAKARIISPGDGMVVYATSSRASWRGNDEPMDEGKEVREREQLIHLPTTDAMMVELTVHESNLDKIAVGLAVRVEVGALPGRPFTGRIAKIAPLPDAQSMWMNPDLKVYRTEVHIEEVNEALRTGMSCQTEILIEHYDDCIHVPLQAVARGAHGGAVVYVQENEAFVPRSVEIGLDNNRVVVIEKGLAEGEIVSLTPPLDQGDDLPGPADVDAGEVDSIRNAIDTARKNRSEAAQRSAAAAPGAPVPAAARESMDPQAGAGRPAGHGTAEGAPQAAGEGRRGRRGGPGAEGGDAARRMQNMSEEERAAMMERFRNMSPEERERLRSQRGGRERGERGGGSRSGPGEGDSSPRGARDGG